MPKEPELERDHLRKTIAAIEKTVGRKPVGTRSNHSRELLLEHGYVYISEDSMDHQPNWLSAPDGSKPILNLPFHYAIDDAMFFSFAWLGSDNSAQRMMDPDHVEEIWWRMFEQCYRDGGYMNICMHPFVSGRALRIAMLDRLINRMKALPGVWFPTCEQVARHIIGRQALMPWKERYTISDEKSIVDADIKWPDGKRCCFRVVVDLSPACGPDGITPADLATPDAYYGMNGGLAALVERARPLRHQGDLRGARRHRGDPGRQAPSSRRRGPRDRRARLQA